MHKSKEKLLLKSKKKLMVINPKDWPDAMQDDNADWLKRIDNGSFQEADLRASEEALRIHKENENGQQG